MSLNDLEVVRLDHSDCDELEGFINEELDNPIIYVLKQDRILLGTLIFGKVGIKGLCFQFGEDNEMIELNQFYGELLSKRVKVFFINRCLSLLKNEEAEVKGVIVYIKTGSELAGILSESKFKFYGVLRDKVVKYKEEKYYLAISLSKKKISKIF